MILLFMAIQFSVTRCRLIGLAYHGPCILVRQNNKCQIKNEADGTLSCFKHRSPNPSLECCIYVNLNHP